MKLACRHVFHQSFIEEVVGITAQKLEKFKPAQYADATLYHIFTRIGQLNRVRSYSHVHLLQMQSIIPAHVALL